MKVCAMLLLFGSVIVNVPIIPFWFSMLLAALILMMSALMTPLLLRLSVRVKVSVSVVRMFPEFTRFFALMVALPLVVRSVALALLVKVSPASIFKLLVAIAAPLSLLVMLPVALAVMLGALRLL